MTAVPSVAGFAALDRRNREACADLLELVDAAFARPGGPAAHQMAEQVCPTCPVWQECLQRAMATGEHGPWGGTTERQRKAVHRFPYTHNVVNTRRSTR